MVLPVSLSALGLAAGIVFVGAMVQGSLGFGLGTLSVPLLLLVDARFVPAPLLCLAFVLTLLIYRRERGAVRAYDLKWGVAGRLLGSLLAALLLRVLPAAAVAPLIGALVLVALALVSGGFRLPINRLSLFGAGTLSGFMGTTASIGGPPMAMLYYDQTGTRLRGTLSGIFIFGTVVALAALASVGRFGATEMVLALCLMPPLLLGFFVSRFSARRLDGGYIRPAILLVSGAAAVLVLVRALL